MIDNVIRSKPTVTQGPVVWFSDFVRDTDLTSIGNTFTVPNPMYTSGRLVDIDNTIVSPSAINPSEPTLPPTEPNMHGPVVEVAVGSSDVQIQQAINAAVTHYNGQRPVVHIPEGTYNLANTVTIPANSDVQLVGDGMFTTVLVYTGSGSGPTVQIQGPSHATLRDIGLNGSQRVDALDVK
jgi:pectin methylesterase-like acyl-CoA thioesterase